MQELDKLNEEALLIEFGGMDDIQAVAKLYLQTGSQVGKAKFIIQNHGEATYAKKIHKDETKIDWNQNAKTIIGKINGLSPMPGAWFNFDNKRHKILSADLVQEEGTPCLLYTSPSPRD